MSKPVIVVETQEKAETLKTQMGEKGEVLLLTAPPARVAVCQPDEPLRRRLLRFEFSPAPEAAAFLDELCTCQGREVYLGLDGDWRGEYWAWLLSGYWDTVSQGSGQLRRLGLAGLSGDLFQESFRLVEPTRTERAMGVHVRLAFEGSMGRHLQRLLGTRSGPNGLPLNYLSLTTLFLLAERETEIRMYSPIPRWRLKVKVSTAVDGDEAELALDEAYGITDDGLLRNEKEVHGAISLFNAAEFVVRDVERTHFSLPPPPPYHLPDFLQDAVVLAGLSPSAAFTALRSLYHGVELDGRRVGLVSAYFPVRNGATDTMFRGIREQAGVVAGGVEKLGPELHFGTTPGMIVPLFPEYSPDALQDKLGATEAKVYQLVWARALGSQLGEARGEALRISVEAGGKCRFVGTANKVTDPGFLALYQGCTARDMLASSPLTEVGQGQQLRCVQVLPEKHAGYPPEYHTFSSLAADLGELAVECDGTTVLMLQQMLDKGYLKLMPDGTFRCAENAGKLVAVMNRAFPSMKGINFSAYLAQTIDEVVTSRKPFLLAMQQFEQTLMMRGEVLVKIAVPVSVRKRGISSRSIIRTPAMDAAQPGADEVSQMRPSGDVVVKGVGARGVDGSAVLPEAEEVLAVDGEGGVRDGGIEAPEAGLPDEEAPNGPEVEADEASGEAKVVVPEAEMSLTATEELEETQESPEEEALSPELSAAVNRMFAEATDSIVPEESIKAVPQPEAAPVEEVRVIEGQAKECPECGRSLLLKEDRFGKFWSCSGHPECRHSESYEGESVSAMPCPLCRIGQVISKHTPTGKLFYVCPEAECEFMSWAKPHAIPCRVCGSPFLVERRTVSGTTVLHCPKAGCNYMQPLAGSEEEAAAQPRKKVLVRRVVRPGGAAPAGGAIRKVRVVRKKQ